MRQRRSYGRSRVPTAKYAINEKITASQVRLIDENGEQRGIVSIDDARRMAEEAGLDLIELAPEADPPVCRILDYGKLKYKEQKKAAEARKKGAAATVKELRVSYRTDSHDLDTKVRKARNFLEGGDRVRFQMRFRGREVVYRDLGLEIFDRIAESLSDVAEVEERTPLVGMRMTVTLVPRAGGAKKESSSSNKESFEKEVAKKPATEDA